jgi:hypothetical protein
MFRLNSEQTAQQAVLIWRLRGSGCQAPKRPIRATSYEALFTRGCQNRAGSHDLDPLA